MLMSMLNAIPDPPYHPSRRQYRPGNHSETSHRTKERQLISPSRNEVTWSSSHQGSDQSSIPPRSAGSTSTYKHSVHIYSNPSQTSFNWRAGRSMAGALDADRSRSRRERTFIGSECAVCEEPLEHTLQGERILQLSCAHVSHEACFYEFIKEPDSQYCPTCNAPLGLDSTRGGNVLDLGMTRAPFRSQAEINNNGRQIE
jgi:hypothetical protein